MIILGIDTMKRDLGKLREKFLSLWDSEIGATIN